MLFSLSALFTSPLLASFPNDLPKKVEVNKPQFEYPAKISVERVINDILVIPVEVHGNSWPLTDEAALYMANSGKVKMRGNIVIYGHNSPKIFGLLVKSKLGDTIIITTNLNEQLAYKIDAIKFVPPQDVSILTQDENAKITLYTCTGFWDSQRLVITGNKI